MMKREDIKEGTRVVPRGFPKQDIPATAIKPSILTEMVGVVHDGENYISVYPAEYLILFVDG
jgi:hypothetical protein